ncbi:hypothetical protein CLNEO_10350 [Anaerotignum neopropionicum]|uniref:Uncharacterized protein n=1 Tax=Anaerotignum neopropionicum TaxID=36847 RepID=A0A136WHI5_9FIRM|nr:DUF6550 family protein [Anaerotignum neopropionicum]KXL53809.1 hypothetical protein CLNEO_10350 [Anaerotignum neopropionicum]
MKNMNDKTKKWLIVAGGLAICAVLAVMIAGRFSKPTAEDVLLPIQSGDGKDIVVEESNNIEKENQITVSPIEVSEQPDADNGAVDQGTEQTIQGDAKKPTYTQEELTNPDQKPNGDEVTEQDKPVDHDKVETPSETQIQDEQPQSGDKKDGQIYVPGFGWIKDEGGGGEATVGKSDGDINKQVGIMGE